MPIDSLVQSFVLYNFCLVHSSAWSIFRHSPLAGAFFCFTPLSGAIFWYTPLSGAFLYGSFPFWCIPQSGTLFGALLCLVHFSRWIFVFGVSSSGLLVLCLALFVSLLLGVLFQVVSIPLPLTRRL